ncbi:sialate O-acetylesterase [Puniceicoccus vermicola]|nr:sialate O-acetylesterase [Puniceicoccus vermicola]
MSLRKIPLLPVLSAFLFAITAQAELKLPSILSDHMVIQAEKPIKLWGWATPDAEISATFLDSTRSTRTRSDGTWLIELPAAEANAQPETIRVEGDQQIVKIEDVLVGEVWLCGGQSNMQMKLQNVDGGESAIREANFPEIRFFEARRRPNINPQDDIAGKWQKVTPQTIREFSAVGYFFGLDLSEALGTPVGLISSNKGGTPAEAWMPSENLRANPILRPYTRDLDDLYEAYPDLEDSWDEIYDEMRASHREWKKQFTIWTKLPKNEQIQTPKPEWRQEFRLRKAPTIYYNSNIHPLRFFPIRGVIWYQGEANSNNLQDAALYGTLFPEMIQSWRDAWGETLPFYFVQLPGYGGRPGIWPTTRQSQLSTWQNVPKTGMVVTIDVGNENNIHPKNKRPVGERLARFARANTYGEEIPFSGPVVKTSTRDGTVVEITFNHIEGGLAAKDGSLGGFEIADNNSGYLPAETAIHGNSVRVWSPSIDSPTRVRYAWTDTPEAYLFNGAGLPASPFEITEIGE